MSDRCLISKSIEFDAGHRVPWHGSKCRNPHGHRYMVVAHVAGPIIDATEGEREDAGMVVDFGCIKAILMERVHDPFDHGFMVWTKDSALRAALTYLDQAKIIMLPCIPTAEELARWIYHDTAPHFTAAGVDLIEIEVRETPTSVAHYFGGEL